MNMYCWDCCRGSKGVSEDFFSQGEVSKTCGGSFLCQAREIGNTMREGWRFTFDGTHPSCQQQAEEFVLSVSPL